MPFQALCRFVGIEFTDVYIGPYLVKSSGTTHDIKECVGTISNDVEQSQTQSNRQRYLEPQSEFSILGYFEQSGAETP